MCNVILPYNFIEGTDMAVTKHDYEIDLGVYKGTTVSLSDKQKRMAEAMVAGMSQKDARIAAGYPDLKDNTKNVQNAHNLVRKNPDIAIYVDYLRTMRREKFSLTADDLYKNLAAITHFDPALLFNADGSPIGNIHDIPLRARACIKKMNIVTKYDEDGNPINMYQFEFYSKLDAINSLVRIQEMTNHKMQPRLNGNGKKITLKV